MFVLSSKYESAVLEAKHAQQFDEREIKTLISLCHSDKHAGKESGTSDDPKTASATRWLNLINVQQPSLKGGFDGKSN